MSISKEDQAKMTPLEYLAATNHPDTATAEGYMESHKSMGTIVNKKIYAGIQAGHYKMTNPPSMLGKDIYIFGDKIETGPMRQMLSTPYGTSAHFKAKLIGGKKTRRRRHNKKQKKSKMSKKSKKSRKTRKTRRRRRH